VSDVLLIAGMALVTFLARYPVLVLVGRMPLSPAVFAALRYVPAAVLTAIIVPAMLMPAGTLDASPANDHAVAGLASALIAWKTGNLLLTIVAGMAIFFLLRLF
jgi:branched-subunit amino acid transport protein